MTARKRPVTIQPTPGPTDEPGQQPTPDGDALSEVEQVNVGAGSTLASIANALRAAGVSAARENLDKSFSRDLTDVDIGYHEGLRWLTLQSFAGLTALDNSLNHVKAIKAMNNEETQHARNSNNQRDDSILGSDSVFHSGLLKSYGLETDNEVLSTVALAKVVLALAC
jgi:hypothetical protein